MAPYRPSRYGFTLLELLVVIAIIGVLIALLVPAIQQVREAAARTQCQNNLKQIGLAVLQYEGQWKVFPIAGGPNTIQGKPNWIPQILPFLDQANMHFDFTKDWLDDTGSPSNLALAQEPLPNFLCPTVPSSSSRRDMSSYFIAMGGGSSPRIPLGMTDYYATQHVSPFFYNSNGLAYPGDFYGVIDDRANRVGHLADGTSTTMMVAEVGGRPRAWRFGNQLPGGAGGYRCAWIFGGGNTMLLQGHSCDPNGDTATQWIGPCVINSLNLHNFYSFHRGGAHFLYADGGVRFLSERMPHTIVAAMMTKAAGETVTSFDP